MAAQIVGNRGRDRLRRILRQTGMVLGLVALALLLIYTAFRKYTELGPVADEGPALPQQAKVVEVEQESRLTAGSSWLTHRHGMWRIHLAGDPREVGHAHGLLAADVSAGLDEHMQTLMQHYLPGAMRRWLIGNLVRLRYHDLPRYIPPERLIELSAFSRNIVDTGRYPEAPFQRLLYYHVLHDMTQRMDGSPLIGCTAFAVWDKQTVGGNLIVGRNFDFEGGAVFDKEKAIIDFAVTGRHRFVSVAWPGLMGVVTGVNEKQLYVSINAARTDEPHRSGIPMVFLVREILERAATIKEALLVMRKHEVMVAEEVLIADGKEPRAVVVELAPGKLAVREAKAGRLGVTNHLKTPTYKADASNDWLRRYTTSDARYKRLMELLGRFGGRIDPPTAALILRNRADEKDAPLALGNRRALDALIATHSVVVDLTQMVLWVSKGPHLLGPYVAVDLREVFELSGRAPGTPPPPVVEADPLASSPRFEAYRLARNAIERALELRAHGDLGAARGFAERAVALEPTSPDARKLAGDILWQLGCKDEARAHYTAFLDARPPYLKEVEAVRARLAK